MNEIINFVKGIFMLETEELVPIGLCGFEHSKESVKPRRIKPKRKRELRLSELME